MARIGTICPSCGKAGIQHLQQTQQGAQATCACCGKTRILDDESAQARAHRRDLQAFVALSRAQQYLS
jgi:hypothetical protein